MTTCTYEAPARLPDGTVHQPCGFTQATDDENPNVTDFSGGNTAVVRYRRL